LKVKSSISDFILTVHAKKMLQEREISMDWLVQVFRSPFKTQPDKDDPELTHALGKIAEHGNRVLRVVYNAHVRPKRIVTVYFDRTLKGEI
jgi:hypothetical protein